MVNVISLRELGIAFLKPGETYPDVNFGADVVSAKFVNHFRRPVHHRCILLVGLKSLVYLVLCKSFMCECGCA